MGAACETPSRTTGRCHGCPTAGADRRPLAREPQCAVKARLGPRRIPRSPANTFASICSLENLLLLRLLTVVPVTVRVDWGKRILVLNVANPATEAASTLQHQGVAITSERGRGPKTYTAAVVTERIGMEGPKATEMNCGQCVPGATAMKPIDSNRSLTSTRKAIQKDKHEGQQMSKANVANSAARATA